MASRRSRVSCAVLAAALSSRACTAEGASAAGPACTSSACLPSYSAASRHSAQPLPDAASPDRRLSSVPEGPHLCSWPCRLCAAPLVVSPQGSPAAVLANTAEPDVFQFLCRQPLRILLLLQHSAYSNAKYDRAACLLFVLLCTFLGAQELQCLQIRVKHA